MLKNISTSKIFASIFIAIILGLAIGYVIGKSKGRPVVYYYDIWSIGIYEGESPFELKPAQGVTNPVLTAESVTDAKADYVADPFVIIEQNPILTAAEKGWNSKEYASIRIDNG